MIQLPTQNETKKTNYTRLYHR